MPRFTKRYMHEDYERLYDHASLLDLYLFDTQAGHKPSATERYSDKSGEVQVQLWHADSASGGYVIVLQSLPNIWYLDDAMQRYADNHSVHTLGIRICLERLRVFRNRAYEAKEGRPLMDSERLQPVGLSTSPGSSSQG